MKVAPAPYFPALLGPNGAGKTTISTSSPPCCVRTPGSPGSTATTWRAQGEGVRAAIGLTGQFSAVDTVLTGEEQNLLLDL